MKKITSILPIIACIVFLTLSGAHKAHAFTMTLVAVSDSGGGGGRCHYQTLYDFDDDGAADLVNDEWGMGSGHWSGELCVLSGIITIDGKPNNELADGILTTFWDVVLRAAKSGFATPGTW